MLYSCIPPSESQVQSFSGEARHGAGRVWLPADRETSWLRPLAERRPPLGAMTPEMRQPVASFAGYAKPTWRFGSFRDPFVVLLSSSGTGSALFPRRQRLPQLQPPRIRATGRLYGGRPSIRRHRSLLDTSNATRSEPHRSSNGLSLLFRLDCRPGGGLCRASRASGLQITPLKRFLGTTRQGQPTQSDVFPHR